MSLTGAPGGPGKGIGSSWVKNGVLLLLSMVLVVGFWGHSAFYDIGLVPLIFIGGGVTFAFLKLITWANDTGMMGVRSRGALLFRPDEVRLVQYGSKSISIRPLRKTRMRAGTVYDAKLSVVSDRPFARLLVVDVYRRRLGELTEEEAGRDGAGSLSEWRQRWEAAAGGWDPSEIVRVIEFRTLRSFRMDGA
jgi:hypothetical protein